MQTDSEKQVMRKMISEENEVDLFSFFFFLLHFYYLSIFIWKRPSATHFEYSEKICKYEQPPRGE